MGDPAIAHSFRYATRNELQRYDHTTTLGRWKWPTDTGRRETDWLAFLGLLVRDGFDGIKAAQGAISDAQWRCQHGTRSSATTYRALAELERLGYIRRRRLRLGSACLGIWLEFTDKLRGLLSYTRHTPPVESAHIDSHLSICETDDLTIPSVPPPHPSGFISKATRARRKQTAERWEPIAYTARCAAKNATERARITWLVLAGLRGELPACGISWEHWRGRWPAMTPAERDHVFAVELRPHLDQVGELLAVDQVEEIPAVDLEELPAVDQVEHLTGDGLPIDDLKVLFWARSRARANEQADF